jgi:RNase P/RNase MRP subunit POP5
MKPLKPSHREHKRYLLLAGKDANKKEIEDAILKFIGVLGFAKACPEVVKSTGKGIILSVNRKEVDKIRAAFLLSGKDICIKNVSGILRKV